ncbi:MAG: hypothetical protein CXT73_02450 [Methanobacteriota archaeon]|nr:MAG: hypothetical protein CXT73_02450 [Euryarchaeota archaeon]
MEKQTKSILEEINSIVPRKDKNMIVESRADHVITSVINLVHLIKETYSEEDAQDLTKRLFNSIKTEDPRKFNRGMNRVKDENKRYLK